MRRQVFIFMVFFAFFSGVQLYAETYIVFYITANRTTEETVVEYRAWTSSLPSAGSKVKIQIYGDLYHEEFDAAPLKIENLGGKPYVVFFYIDEFERFGDFNIYVHALGYDTSQTQRFAHQGKITNEHRYFNQSAKANLKDLQARPYLYSIRESAYYRNYYYSPPLRRSFSTDQVYTAHVSQLNLRVPGYSSDPINTILKSLCERENLTAIHYFVVDVDGMTKGEYTMKRRNDQSAPFIR